MSTTSASTGPAVVIARHPATAVVTASGGDGLAHGILERTLFLREVRGATWHRLSPMVAAEDEQAVAQRAVARLQAAGYQVLADEEFATPCTEDRYVTTGRSIENLAERIRQTPTAGEVSELLDEVTATHDGILASLGNLLHALADVYKRLDGPSEWPVAERMHYLADWRLGPVAEDLLRVRADLADRGAPPGRRGPYAPPPAPPAPTSAASGRTR
ncbi:hypothetical protein SLA_7140 [Streptomyces laurentii]|uniref:Uncharacterized protein n=1 Tax=Streptomyces laurentii TaxID=39478 RepID=A0A160P973_STRLU|nr:hypothetical protein SLA_7140 [Streptomyces laurentii]